MRVIRKKSKNYDKLGKGLGGDPKVAVGFPRSKADGADIMKAIYNEFGTRGGGWGGPTPERPFMRNAMRNNKAKYQAAMRKSAAKILQGETSLSTVLNKLGALAQGDIQSEITTLKTPANSPVTIARKGSSNPLIDTGSMRQSVTWEIRS